MLQVLRRPSRLRRYAKRAGVSLAALLGFVLLAACGALFSLRFAGVRAYIVSRVNQALADSFKGRVVLHRVASLGLGGLAGADAEIFDPSGRRVVDVHGFGVKLSVPTIVWAALSDKSAPLSVRMTAVSLQHVEVVLIDDGTGSPTLAQTFAPKKPTPPSSGPGTVVIIEHATLEHVWAHGALGGTGLDVELKDARGSLRTDSVKTAIQIAQTTLRARGLPSAVDPQGQLRASLEIPAAPAKPLSARAHYQGSAAQIPVVLDANYVEEKLAAELQANSISPAALAKQLPGVQLRSPASLSASLVGKMPNLHGTFALGLGAEGLSKAEGDFDLALQKELRVRANLRTHQLDLAELSPSAPTSSLELTLKAGARVPEAGPITGTFDLSSPPAAIARQRLPALSVTGSFSNDAKTKLNRVEAHAEIAEPGAPTSLDLSAVQSKTTDIEFRSNTKLNNPPRLRQLAAISSAQGRLDTRGSYRLEDRALNVRARAELQQLQQGPNRVASARLDLALNGALPSPNATLELSAQDATLGGQRVQEARLAARGPLSRLALDAEIATRAPERHVQLSALLSNQRGLSLDHPSLNLRQGDTNLHLSAERVESVNGRTKVDALRLEGAGKAELSLTYGAALENLRAETSELDLARLWRLVDANAPLKSGTATLSANYDRRGGVPRVHLHAESRDLAFERVTGGTMIATFDLDQGQLQGNVYADLKQLGTLSIDAQDVRGLDVERPNPARLTGKLSVMGQARLKDLMQLIPAQTPLPISRALGVIKYDMAVEREQASNTVPTFHVHVATQKLQLAEARESTTTIRTKAQAQSDATFAIKGIDVDLDLTHAESGETELAASLSDAQGKLVALSVSANARPKLATVTSELGDQWRQMPLSVRIAIPRRDLGKLPIEVRPAGLEGVLSAEFASDGSLSAPDLRLSGRVEKLRQVEGRKSQALDVAWQGGYAAGHGAFKAAARAGDRDVAHAQIDFETALNDWLNQAPGQTPPVRGNAQLDFAAFPIGILPSARTSQLEGSLTGKVTLQRFGTDAAFEATLDADSLTLGNSPLGRVHSEVRALAGKADATLQMVSKDGITSAEAHSGLDWGARLVPAVRMPADAALHARQFRLAAFEPFVTSIFGEMDGRLNGDLNAHFRGGPPELDGHLDLKDGAFQVAAVGQRFDQVSARVSLEPGKAKLEQLSARATTGKLRINGEARFEGLSLTGADAHLRIARSEKISLAVAGTELGDTWGAVDLKVRPAAGAGGQALTVDVPEFHVRMPDTGSQKLQDLEPASGVRVGTWQRDGKFVTLPLQPLEDSDPAKNESPLVVELNLGNNIELQQGDTTRIKLGGRLKIVLGQPMTIAGQINVTGGKLDVSGKQFELESGVVTFSGDPSNPTIVATARWDAGDEEHHRVYADASGTANALKVRLRSEPPLTQDQVLSLIVTGSADGSLGSSSGGGGTAATAVGAVGGAATQGINKALSSISDLDVTTRVDTSTGSARPELVLQISPRVSAEITRALGQPQPGQPPDLTFLTLNFRLLTHWSLAALVGDRGETSLDMVWRKRY